MEFLNISLPVAATDFNILVLILIGFCVGVLGGFFGVGGAWIVTPALNIFGFPMPYAIGTDFAHIFGKSILATRKHSKMGNVDWKLGLFSIFGTIAGIEAGAQCIMILEKIGFKSNSDVVGLIVRWTYIILLAFLSLFMFYDYYKYKNNSKIEKNKEIKISFTEKLRKIELKPMISFPVSGIKSISLWLIIIIFFVCGFISGFMGVGGGFIRMPALIYLIGCPTALAVGTDLFIVMLDGAYGCFTYALKGRVDLIAAMLMLSGAAIGAQIGVTAVKYIKGYGIRLLFSFMILFACLSVLLKQFQTITQIEFYNTLSSISIIGSASVLCLIIIVRLMSNYRKEMHPHKV